MHAITGWKPRDSLGRQQDKTNGGLALDKSEGAIVRLRAASRLAYFEDEDVRYIFSREASSRRANS